MKRTTTLPAAAVCAIGVAGAVLRLAHTRACYEESGLILRHQPLTGLLTAAVLAVILLGVITGLLSVLRGKKGSPSDLSASSAPGTCQSFICIAAALLTAAGAVWQFVATAPRTTLLSVSCLLGLAAAAGAVVMSRRSRDRSALLASCAAVGTFFCLELVRHFASNTLNPVTLSFGPECLALGAVSLFAFCLGTARGEARGFGTVCFGLCAAGLCLTALTGPQITWPDRLILLAGTLFSLPFVLRLSMAAGTGEREAEEAE